MREEPTGADLLRTARALLQDELLPAIQGRERHTARMIMRAMDIAARELTNGDAPLREEEASLEALAPTIDGDLVTFIRRGGADPGQPARAAVLAHLRLVTRARVLESNPRALDSP